MAQNTTPIPPLKPSQGQNDQTHAQSLGTDIPVPAIKPVYEAKAAFVNKDTVAQPVVLTTEAMSSNAIFTDKQARLYEEIFALQDRGDIEGANEDIKKLSTNLLMGHVLAERYLHPVAYKSSYAELADWMKNYSDHPQAQRIYKLALSRAGNEKTEITKPVSSRYISGNIAGSAQQAKSYISKKKRSADEEKRVQKLYKEIQTNIKQERPTLAMSILSNDYAVQFMDDVEFDRQRAIIAAGYFYAGKNKDALRLAQESLNRSGANVPLAGWIKGLVEWENKNYNQAASGFQIAASSQYSSGWLLSAAAYWASRAHMRQGNMDLVSQWLSLAATYPRTFYGLIAIRALGHDNHFNWNIPPLSRDDIKNIESTPQGQRAMALISAGQKGLAEDELKTLVFDDDLEKKRSLLAYANHYNLPSLLMMLGNSFSGPRGNYYDAALYPEASWTPTNGYAIDKALLHAIIRQESRFQYNVANASGATGLMQLMPATANYIAGEDDKYNHAAGQHELLKPEVNMALGQKYIKELLDHHAVQNDLMALAIAYNAGPGNLSKWKSQRTHIDDPLLFIETIPYNETRAFVERVLSNYWIYKMRFQEPTPSLDAVAEGKWAMYVAELNSKRLAAR